MKNIDTRRRPTEVIRDFAQLICRRGDRLNWYEAVQLAVYSKNWIDLVELRTAIATLNDLAIEIYYGAMDNYSTEIVEIVDDVTKIDNRIIGDRLPTEDDDVNVTVLSLITMLTELCAVHPEIGSMRAVSGIKDITAAVVIQMGGEHVLSIY